MFWLGAIASLCYVPGLTGAFIATQWPLFGAVLPFVLLRTGPFTWLHGLWVAFILYAAIRVPFSPLPDAGVFAVWLLAIMGLSLWLGTTATTLRKLYAGLAVGGAVSSAIGVMQYAGYDILPLTSIAPAGLYVNSVQQGAVLALLIVALVSERMWLWALPLVPGLLVSGSRGALIALAVGLFGCYARRLWVLLPVACAGAFYLLSPLSSSDQLRVFIWRVTAENLSWLGLGPGMFYTLLMKRDGSTFYPEYAHNDVLQLVFEYGVAAALPVAVFAFVLAKPYAREWPVVVTFIAAGCYSMPFFMPLASFLVLACVGRILRDHADNVVYGSDSRFHVISRRRVGETTGGADLPLAPHH